MSKARHEVAQVLAQHLFAAETATDGAFGSIASLAALLPQLRQQAGVSATVGNAIFTSVAKAVELQALSRAALVDAHDRCKEVADSFRIRSYGDPGVKIGDGDESGNHAVGLRSVG